MTKRIITQCNVTGCDNESEVSQMCRLHYQRTYRTGKTDAKTYLRSKGDTPEQKFWSRVATTADQTQCWEWLGGLATTGYGKTFWHGKVMTAHRCAWSIANSRSTELLILHSCDNRKCVNPNHLREGTHKDNMQDCISRNRNIKGERCGSSKLTDVTVRRVRHDALCGKSAIKIAGDMGVSTSTINRVLSGKTWKHLYEKTGENKTAPTEAIAA